MLRAIATDESPPARAYALPWEVDRTRMPALELRNAGDETLTDVVAQLAGDGWERPPVRVASLPPGSGIGFVLRSLREADSARVAVRWRRADGEKYAWSFVCA